MAQYEQHAGQDANDRPRHVGTALMCFVALVFPVALVIRSVLRLLAVTIGMLGACCDGRLVMPIVVIPVAPTHFDPAGSKQAKDAQRKQTCSRA